MTLAATGSGQRVERWFYIGAALFMILLSVVGFGPSIIDHSRRNAPSTSLVVAHSIATGAWKPGDDVVDHATDEIREGTELKITKS